MRRFTLSMALPNSRSAGAVKTGLPPTIASVDTRPAAMSAASSASAAVWADGLAAAGAA